MTRPAHPLYLKPVIMRGTVVEVFGDPAEEVMVELVGDGGQTLALVTLPIERVEHA